jgi:cyclohexa-1,5-dienecarbonyl-CoA hydratase
VSAYRTIRVSREQGGRLVRVLLAAPKANILTLEMMGEIERAMAAETASESVMAVAFEGEGAHFSFGASVEEHAADRVRTMLPRFHGMFRALAAPGVPLVALVRGQCLGGGFELAAFADLLFAEEGARLGVPEIKLGVFPPVAAALLPGRIGSPRANELILTGRTLTAEEAHGIGLLTALSASGRLAEDFAAWMEERLLPLSPASLRFATRAARRAWLPRFFEDLGELERLYLDELCATPDASEGIAAFIERRSPVWRSRCPA